MLPTPSEAVPSSFALELGLVSARPSSLLSARREAQAQLSAQPTTLVSARRDAHAQMAAQRIGADSPRLSENRPPTPRMDSARLREHRQPTPRINSARQQRRPTPRPSAKLTPLGLDGLPAPFPHRQIATSPPAMMRRRRMHDPLPCIAAPSGPLPSVDVPLAAPRKPLGDLHENMPLGASRLNGRSKPPSPAKKLPRERSDLEMLSPTKPSPATMEECAAPRASRRALFKPRGVAAMMQVEQLYEDHDYETRVQPLTATTMESSARADVCGGSSVVPSRAQSPAGAHDPWSTLTDRRSILAAAAEARMTSRVAAPTESDSDSD